MSIPMPGCNRTTSSLFHRDSSRLDGTKAESTRSRALVAFALATALSVAGGFASEVRAQTPPPPPSTDPSTPVSPSDQPQSTEWHPRPHSEQVPWGTEPQAPLQQYLIQQPGRPLVTPATPPGTSLPPWTPPAPPAPSQTNIPGPVLGCHARVPPDPATLGGIHRQLLPDDEPDPGELPLDPRAGVPTAHERSPHVRDGGVDRGSGARHRAGQRGRGQGLPELERRDPLRADAAAGPHLHRDLHS